MRWFFVMLTCMFGQSTHLDSHLVISGVHVDVNIRSMSQHLFCMTFLWSLAISCPCRQYQMGDFCVLPPQTCRCHGTEFRGEWMTDVSIRFFSVGLQKKIVTGRLATETCHLNEQCSGFWRSGPQIKQVIEMVHRCTPWLRCLVGTTPRLASQGGSRWSRKTWMASCAGCHGQVRWICIESRLCSEPQHI